MSSEEERRAGPRLSSSRGHDPICDLWRWGMSRSWIDEFSVTERRYGLECFAKSKLGEQIDFVLYWGHSLESFKSAMDAQLEKLRPKLELHDFVTRGLTIVA